MITEKLYQKDVYMKECTSTILEVTGTGRPNDPVSLVLDKTIFFPTGGGQPCDLGTINGIPVIDVSEKDGVVAHKLSIEYLPVNKECPESPKALDSISFEVGQLVQGKLDWELRFRNMQRHCGEHILSGMFFREYGGINRGFHMGDSSMTIDIDIKDINWEQAMRVELLANQAIWANVPVSIRYFENRADAEKLPLRKALTIDKDITIVSVGSEEAPADCVACCGTHPSTSGEVGIIKIIKLESNKGMTRVYFKAGLEAFWDYQNKNDIITKLNSKYSSDDKELIDKIEAQDEKNKAVRQELFTFKTSVLSRYAEELLQIYATDSKEKQSPSALAPQRHIPKTVSVLVKEYKELKVNDLLYLGRQVSASISGLLMLVCPSEQTVLLFSNGTPDCGKLVREYASIYNGKGGGNATNARALFTKDEYLETYIDLISKHLK